MRRARQPDRQPDRPAPRPAHHRKLRYVAVAADGSTVATVGREGRVVLSDPKTGKALCDVPAGHHLVGVGLTGDGQRLAVVTRDNLAVWQRQGGAPMKVLASEATPRGNPPYDVAVRPDGKTVAVLTHDIIGLYDCESLKAGKSVPVTGGVERFGTTLAHALLTVNCPGRRALADAAGRAVCDVPPTAAAGWRRRTASGWSSPATRPTCGCGASPPRRRRTAGAGW